MPWTTRPTIEQYLYAFILWWGMVGFLLLLPPGGNLLWAQAKIYTWTDEKGVVHYSDSTVPSQHLNNATTVIMPPRSSTRSSGSQESESIPLVILNNDPSQKFVRAVLEGKRRSQEVLMLVDTGAQITMIDETLAKELNLEHIQDSRIVGVTGVAQGWIGRLPRLRLGTKEVNNLRVMVAPLAIGRPLLGMDVLEQLGFAVGLRSLQRARP